MRSAARGWLWVELVLAVAIVLGASGRAAADPYHLEDTLRGATVGNASGGSFGPDGWTVTAVGDRIWYALPRLASGYVELTVANVTPDNLPLADHEIFAMYEAGYGIGEPIRYAPDFRLNHYKGLVRIYGTPEPDRTGAMKLMWGICPSGAPGYDACGCASFFEEPFADPGPWTGAPARIRIEWGGGRARLLRDGAEVVGVDWSDSGLEFGPSDLHMMIGSPRNDGGLSAMPIGAVFSDLVVDGEDGPLATCPGSTTPDAGAPSDDAGMCSGTAATADGTAAMWEPGVYPDASDLNVEGAPGSVTGVVYLRFPPVDRPVARATLTLETSSGASAGGGSGEICRVDAGGAWDESTLTWSSRPAVSAACSGGARSVGASEVVTWDVTSLVAPGGPVELAIVSSDSDGVHYLSREAGGCAHGPRLDVMLAPGGVDAGASEPSAPTDAAAPASDASGPGTVDASAMDAGSGPAAMDAARPSADAADLESGCGCEVAGAERGARRGMIAIALLAIAITGARRRRARRGAASQLQIPPRH